MNPFTRQESRLSNTLQWVSLFAVSSTFFGFLVVNSYLALYGFWDFNFLKVQYFTAGSLFLFFVALPSTFFYGFLKAVEVLNKYLKENKGALRTIFISVLKVILFGLASSLSFVLFVFPLLLGRTINPPSFIYFLGFVWVAMIFFGVSVAKKSHKEIAQAHSMRITLKNIVIYFGAYYRLLYFLIALPILLFMFSFFVYSSVPRYLGGAKPVAVSIGLNSNFNGEEIGVQSPFNAIMVYESENSVLILIDGGTYLIKQADISYVKYLATIAKIHGLQDFTNLTSTTTKGSN
ncbi:MAG TPA: hypothetical protein VGE53_01315 [Candidatus Paceibacterota bacterium]